VIGLGKLSAYLRLELKSSTDNVRQRGCVGDIMPSVARPTLTHKQRKEADKYGRQNKQTRN
jgi:hypothetical protein